MNCSRLPCPSPTLGACSNSCSLSHWCYPTIAPSVVPFSCPWTFPASGSFPMSQLFASSGQSIGASASVNSPSNGHSGLISFRTDWFNLLAVQGILKSLLQNYSLKVLILRCSAFFMVQIFTDWIMSLLKFTYWSLNPQQLRMWIYLEIRFL